MDNKVGDTVLSDQVAVELLGQLDQVLTELNKHGIVLDVDNRKRLLHARRGSEPMIQRVLKLAAQYNVALPGIPLAGMQSDLALFQALHPFSDRFRVGLALVEDTAGQAESEAWEAFLAYYATLSSMAGRIPELAAELQPVTEFMAKARRTKGKPAVDETSKPA